MLWEFILWWFLTPCLSTLFIVFCTSSVNVSQKNNKIWFDVINVLFFLSAWHTRLVLVLVWTDNYEKPPLNHLCEWLSSHPLSHVQCSLHGNKHLCSLLQRPNSFHRNYASVLHVKASINNLPSIIWSVTALAAKIITIKCFIDLSNIQLFNYVIWVSWSKNIQQLYLFSVKRWGPRHMALHHVS